MKINPDFTIQKVGSTWVAVPVGQTSKHFHAMLQLNETGAFLWNLMSKKDVSEAELVDALLEEYDVEREIAERDVARIVASLAESGVFA